MKQQPSMLSSLDFTKTLDVNMVLALAVAMLLSVLSLTPAGKSIDDMTRSFEFGFRSLTNHRATLDPRIKVIAFDDATTSQFGYHDMSLSKWNYLVYGLSKTEPESVYILQPFHSVLGDSYAKKFAERMAKFPFPIYVSALAPRHPLDRPQTTGESLLESPRSSSPRWLNDQEASLMYGPHETIEKSFTRFGHMQSAGFGRIRPVIRIGQDGALPHISLAGEELQLVNTGIVGKKMNIPVDDNGLTFANLVAQDDIKPATFSLGDIYEKLKAKEKLTRFNTGDVIVILPQMSTGHKELRPTPLGEMPLNLVHLSVINSRLTNEWLKKMPGELALIIICCIIGSLLATWMKNAVVVPVILASIVAVALGSLALFLFSNTIVSWLFPCLGLATCSMATMIRKSLHSEHVAKLVRHGLEGRMSPERINSFLANGDQARLEATEQDVTIMFIDIVGFSRSSNRKDPQGVFSNLKRIFGEMREIVHEYGGDVDRTMGDALLCVFGYRVGDGADTYSHADQALKCAEAIQRANVNRIVAHHQEGVVFPLRIGINTAKVYVGNLGDDKRIDLTVIGAGVNFAQRLESSCDRNMIMVGPDTKAHLRHATDLGAKLVKRMIRVKHEDELNEAYEYNPFGEDLGYLRKAEESYRRFINAKRLDNRLQVPDEASVEAETILGRGKIIDISQGGLALELPSYLAVGVPLAVNFVSSDRSIEENFRKLGLVPLTGIIRWGSCVDGRYVHGLEYKNLTQDQKAKIYQVIATAIEQHRKAS